MKKVKPEDRDLDARIAVELFGWRWYTHDRRYMALFPPDDGLWVRWNFHHENKICNAILERYSDWDRVGGVAEDADKQPWGPMAIGLPRFSTSIEAAMRFIPRRMHDLGFWMKLQGPWQKGEEGFVGFTPHGATGWNGRSDYRAKCKMGEEAGAMCRAAIAALSGVLTTREECD